MPVNRTLFEVAVVVADDGTVSLRGTNHTEQAWDARVTTQAAPGADGSSRVEVTVTLRATVRGEIITDMEGDRAKITEPVR